MTESSLCLNYSSRWFSVAATIVERWCVARLSSRLRRPACGEVKTIGTLMVILFIPLAAARAQVVPAATGPGRVGVPGYFHFSFRYSQTAQFGSEMDDRQTSVPSVYLSYETVNQRHRFSVEYGGGYTWTLTGPTYSTGFFQHLVLSQGFEWRKWKATISDDLSYLPQAPVSGFSGIPGVGEPIGEPPPNTPPSQTILTLDSPVVRNSVNGDIQHSLSYRSSLSVGGGMELLRYPDGDGVDTNMGSANAGVTRRFNARNSASFDYQFSQFSYPDLDFSFVTNTGFFGFHRVWNRKFTSDVSAGPQWISSSQSMTIPSSLGFAVNAAVNYEFRSASAGLNYSRGANGGSGYLLGSQFDAVTGNFSGRIGRDLKVGAEGAYRLTTGLRNNEVINTEYGGVQVTRTIGRLISVFVNYTAMNQSSSTTLPAGALHQLLQVVGFGIEYSPREKHLKL